MEMVVLIVLMSMCSHYLQLCVSADVCEICTCGFISLQHGSLDMWDVVDHGDHHDTYVVLAEVKEEGVYVDYVCVTVSLKAS